MFSKLGFDSGMMKTKTLNFRGQIISSSVMLIDKCGGLLYTLLYLICSFIRNFQNECSFGTFHITKTQLWILKKKKKKKAKSTLIFHLTFKSGYLISILRFKIFIFIWFPLNMGSCVFENQFGLEILLPHPVYVAEQKGEGDCHTSKQHIFRSSEWLNSFSIM